MSTNMDQQIETLQAKIVALVAETQTAERERCIRILQQYADDTAPSRPDDERSAVSRFLVAMTLLLRAESGAP